MRPLLAIPTIIAFAVFSVSVFSQSNEQRIFDTEKAFERAVAEKGINQAFVEFLSPQGVMFMPTLVNAREAWSKRSPSPASLTWNPMVIEVSSNGVLGYSIGNSEYRPTGKDDKNVFYGHYLSVWTRQPDGGYLAALDAGINHPKSNLVTPTWTPTNISSKTPEKAAHSSGDGSVGFFTTAEQYGHTKAFKSYLADDAMVLREGQEPFRGKRSAIAFLEKEKININYSKRKSFIEAGDLGYVYSTYSTTDKKGVATGNGNFVQVWKYSAGKWQIVADIMLAIPETAK